MITRLFVDSRYAASRSGSSYEFSIDGGVELTAATRVWLSDFQCVNAWQTLDSTNQNFFIVEEGGGSQRTFALQAGAHDFESLITELQTNLNSGSKPVSMGTYIVERIGSSSGSASFTRIRVTCDGGAGFQIPSDEAIPGLFLVSDPRSTNAILPFPTGMTMQSSHTTTFVDLRRTHSIYVHAPSFGAYNSYGTVVGARTILAKVPVNVAYGELLTWVGSGSEHDCIEAGVRGLQMLKLSLRDAHGNDLDLDSTHWSATLVFERQK